MKNEDLKAFITETFNERACEAHTQAIADIQTDIGFIKIEIAKIVTAYKVLIAIGSAVGVVVGFFIELFYRST